MVNHWWQVPLYVTSRGLTTSIMPYGARGFQLDFDFIDHALVIRTSDGATETVALAPRSVADFHAEVMGRLRGLGLETRDLDDAGRDTGCHPVRAGSHARAPTMRSTCSGSGVCWFRPTGSARFSARDSSGKVSPVHFFWGSFDLAVTRFSGRAAPPIDRATRPTLARGSCRRPTRTRSAVAASGRATAGSARRRSISYAYPEPAGFGDAPVRPGAAGYDQELGQFILTYDAVREAASPDECLLEFLQSSYDAAADLAHWDRGALERAASAQEAHGR